MKVPSSTLVLVADGRVVRVLRNAGEALGPKLITVQEIRNDPNPPTRLQGDERPARVHSSVGARRSAVEAPDLHDRSEAAFARRSVAELAALRAGDSRCPIIVAAPPRMLGQLREELAKSAAHNILAELDKDLTKHSLVEIAALLMAA